MNPPESDRILKLATLVALVVLVVAGSFYFGALPRKEGPSAPVGLPAHGKPGIAPAGGAVGPAKPGAASDGSSQAPARTVAGRSAPAAGVLLDMATTPTVLPKTWTTAVEDVLAPALPSLSACWHEVAGSKPAREGRLILHFEVGDDGRPADLEVSTRGGGADGGKACFERVAGKLDFGGVAAGTSVFWPVVLDPRAGARLR